MSTPLKDVVQTAPAGPASGLWRAGPGDYRLMIRRTDAMHTASVTVRLVDPIGRSTERTYRIESGSVLPLLEVSEITSFAIAGQGTKYTFTIDNALDGEIAGSAYGVRITLQRTLPRPGTPTPPVIRPPIGGAPPRLPGRIIPLPGPMIELRPGRGGTQFTEEGDTLVFESPIGDIPVTAPAEAFSVSRQRVGNRVTITVSAREKIRSIQARVSSPDGTAVTRSGRG
jgi:hypothetical protein